MDFATIAARLGFANKGSACKAYHRALARVADPDGVLTTEQKRQLEVDQLDRLQQGLWAKAARGDLGAVDRILKISAARRQLEALDPPRHAMPVPDLEPRQPGEVVPESAVQRLREKRARDAAARAAGDG